VKELLREPDPIRLGHFRSILESRGIAVSVRYGNESDMLGLQRFERPKFWPALCVVEDSDHAAALEILKEFSEGDEARSRTEVACDACGEPNPGNFECCWNCGRPIPDPA
jgi:hypothetical protein